MGSKLNAKGIVGNSVEEYRGIGLTCGSRESLWGPDMVSWKEEYDASKGSRSISGRHFCRTWNTSRIEKSCPTPSLVSLNRSQLTIRDDKNCSPCRCRCTERDEAMQAR